MAFVSAIYANMQALRHSNVETVIVFRACSPIAVTIVEYLFMDRAFPNIRSILSLLLVRKHYEIDFYSFTNLTLKILTTKDKYGCYGLLHV